VAVLTHLTHFSGESTAVVTSYRYKFGCIHDLLDVALVLKSSLIAISALRLFKKGLSMSQLPEK
jgi:hypothetical protein